MTSRRLWSDRVEQSDEEMAVVVMGMIHGEIAAGPCSANAITGLAR